METEPGLIYICMICGVEIIEEECVCGWKDTKNC